MIKKIFSSLLFSTATLGGVVGLVAQTNQDQSTSASEATAPSVQARETTKAVLSAEPLKTSEVSSKEEAKPEATLLTGLVSKAPSARPNLATQVETTEELAYEEVQTVRTGFKPVAPQVIEAQPAPQIEEAKVTETSVVETVKTEPVVASVSPVSTPQTTEQKPLVTTNEAIVSVQPTTEKTEPTTETVAPSLSEQPAPVVEKIEVPVADKPASTPISNQADSGLEVTSEPVSAPKEEPASPVVAPFEPEAALDAVEKQELPAPVASEPVNAEPVKVETPISEPIVSAPIVEPVKVEVAPVQPATPVAAVTPLSTERMTTSVSSSVNNSYPVGQCTWGVKALASWVGDHWGNAGEWANSARAAGYAVGTTPTVGAVAVWPKDGGGYGHVALVTSVETPDRIQVSEANYAGNQSIGNYRGWFNPTSSTWGGEVYYIYPSF